LKRGTELRKKILDAVDPIIIRVMSAYGVVFIYFAGCPAAAEGICQRVHYDNG